MPANIQDFTPRDWARIGEAQRAHRRREYEWCLRLLAACGELVDEFPISQLGHCLQVATRAVRAGAGEELTLAALLHDVAKPLSLVNHPRVGAEILRPYVAADTFAMLLHHGEFLADVTHGTAGREQYHREPWYGDAVRFAGWDAASFDASYDALPLEYFLPALRRLYGVD